MQQTSIETTLDAAQQLMFANRYSDARKKYQALVQQNPSSGEAEAGYALFLNYSRELSTALTEADAATKLSPADGHVAAINCRAADWNALYAEALALCVRAVKLAPDDMLAHLFYAEVLADTGDPKSATAQVSLVQNSSAAKSSPYFQAEAYRELANAAADAGDNQNQIANLQKALGFQPKWIERNIELVSAYTGNHDDQNATKVLDSAINEIPSDTDALTSLGAAAMNNGDYTAAQALYGKALGLAPDSAGVLIGAAQVEIALNRNSDAAEADLLKLLRADPHNVSAAQYLMAIDTYIRNDSTRWQTELAQISSQPVDPVGTLQQHAQEALDEVNAVRVAAGLPRVKLNANLSDSAERHSFYWFFNNASPTVDGLGIHKETPGMPGFRGVNPWNRALAAGYPTGRIGEDITHRSKPADAIHDWVDSVYHRFAILRPDLIDIGYGEASAGPLLINDMEFGFASSTPGPASVFPPANATGVETTFFDNELPDPVPAGSSRVTGYPVTVTFPVAEAVRLNSFTVTDSAGNTVTGYLLNPSVETENSASFLPESPLQSQTKYVAAITATVDGARFSRTWSFTTA